MINIIEDGAPITLTRSEYNRYAQEYRKTYQYYSGVVPTIEEYIRGRLQEQNTNKANLLNEGNENPVFDFLRAIRDIK